MYHKLHVHVKKNLGVGKLRDSLDNPQKAHYSSTAESIRPLFVHPWLDGMI